MGIRNVLLRKPLTNSKMHPNLLSPVQGYDTIFVGASRHQRLFLDGQHHPWSRACNEVADEDESTKTVFSYEGAADEWARGGQS